VPFADFLNHHNVETEAYFDDKERCYKIFTKTPFKQGQEVFISYGKYGNLSLLNLYGFVIPDNLEDSYMLDDPRIEQALRGLEADHALLTRKLSLLEDLPLTRAYFAKREEISWNMVSIVRLMCMRADELARENVFAALFEEDPARLKHEEQVWRFIKQLMRDLLRLGFPSSTEEDERLLSTAPVSYRLRCSVGLRLGRKLVLRSIADMNYPN
jgi:hypothetical protein